MNLEIILLSQSKNKNMNLEIILQSNSFILDALQKTEISLDSGQNPRQLMTVFESETPVPYCDFSREYVA